MTLEKIKNLNLKNYDDIEYLYNTNKFTQKFIKKLKDTNSINNLDIFITYFRKEFDIEHYEYRFIIGCLFEYDYFIKALLNEINFDIFKKIIVRRVIDTLNEASESGLVCDGLIGTGLKMVNYDYFIDDNFKIIKLMIQRKLTKFNYCYLFDNIKYYKKNNGMLENYYRFIAIILHDFHTY